jgi:hypothetical protein
MNADCRPAPALAGVVVAFEDLEVKLLPAGLCGPIPVLACFCAFLRVL